MKTKKFISILAAAAVILCAFSGCSDKNSNNGGKFKVICTLFPQYDFVRVIAGDKVDLNLMTDPGINPHDYEPMSEELTQAKKADLFIYTGDCMEPWVAKRMKTKSSNPDTILDASAGITLNIDMAGQELAEQNNSGENIPLYDPHYWTLPLNAEKMVDTITGKLCLLDSSNAAFYKANAAAYKLKLEALDAGFREAVKNGKRKNIVMADSFALGYFVKEYGIGYMAAQNTCSPAAEPNEAVIARLEKAVTANSAPIVFYRDLSDQKTARTVSEKTGAQMLLFHSCENVTKQEFKSGATYLSLMQQNLKNLKAALN